MLTLSCAFEHALEALGSEKLLGTLTIPDCSVGSQQGWRTGTLYWDDVNGPIRRGISSPEERHKTYNMDALAALALSPPFVSASPGRKEEE